MVMYTCPMCGKGVRGGENHKCKEEDVKAWDKVLDENPDMISPLHPKYWEKEKE